MLEFSDSVIVKREFHRREPEEVMKRSREAINVPVSSSGLSWQPCDVPAMGGEEEGEEEGTMLMLQEIPAGSYEVVNGEIVMKTAEAGRSSTKGNILENKDCNKTKKTTTDKRSKVQVEEKGRQVSLSKDENEDDDEFDMSQWVEFGLHEEVMEGLKGLRFVSPTSIQRLVLPKAIRGGMDIFGAAETGSGKTLAFGLPILNSLLQQPPNPKEGLSALILTPTRELALQVANHLKQVSKHIKVGNLVGGMSIEKQERVLRERPEVVVATPGRLWAMIDDGNEHLQNLPKSLRFLVIDEADKMLDKGRFPDLAPLMQTLTSKASNARKRQTLLFSATLLVDGRHHKGSNKNQKSNHLLSLLKSIGLRGKPAQCVIKKEELAEDESEKKKLKDTVTIPESLTISSLRCIQKDKDTYLYYFLTQHEGRTLVFVNTINSLKRVSAILKLLKVQNVAYLHANMDQKHRLQSLELFHKERRSSVLVATDVAARGLDIPGVDHVVHYAIPKHLETFIHRSGRTARASAKGLCLSLVDSAEEKNFGRIERAIGEKKVEDFPVSMSVLPRIRERVVLAVRIQQIEKKLKGNASDKGWFKRAAAEADLDLDNNIIEAQSQKAHLLEGSAKEAKKLHEKLEFLLAERILGRGVSSKFLTRNRPEERSMLLTGSKRSALDALQRGNSAKKNRRRKKRN